MYLCAYDIHRGLINKEALCLLLVSEKPRKLHHLKTREGMMVSMRIAWGCCSISVFKGFPSTFTLGRGHAAPRFFKTKVSLRRLQKTTKGNNMIRKHLLLLFALFILAGKGFAVSFKIEGINYVANGDTAIVKGYSVIPESGELSLPSDVAYGGKEYRVTAIQSSAFLSCVEIKTLTIPSSIKYIDSGAFENCVNMKKLVLETGNEILDIDDSAFKNCKIEESEIGRNITKSIFKNCKTLKTVVLNNISIIPFSAFYGCSELCSVKFDNVNKIDSYAFEKCEKLVSFDFASITYLGDRSFSNTGIESVVLSNDLYHLGIGVFSGTPLTNAVIKGVITTIPASCFSGCDKLSKIEFPETISVVKKTAFSGCKSLEKFEFNKIETIEEEAFANCGFKELLFSSSLKTLSQSAFLRCSNLEKVDLSKSSIEAVNGFTNCSKLNEIKLPETLTKIGYSCFGGCSSLSTLILPKSLAIIYDEAFDNMTSLKEIDLSHTSVTTIPYKCFTNCSSLELVSLNPVTSVICNNAFKNCSNLSKIENTDNIKIVYSSAFEGTKIFDGVGDGPVMIGSVMYKYNGTIEESEYSVPSNVTCICNNTFANQKFQTIKLNDGLLYVGNGAFDGCNNLLSLTIPNSVETFNSSKGLNSLAVLTIKEGETELYIDKLDNNNIKKLYVGRQLKNTMDWLPNVESIIIAKTVKSFENHLFSSEKIKELDLEDADETLDFYLNPIVGKVKTLYMGRNISVGTYKGEDEFDSFNRVTTLGNSFRLLEELGIGPKVNTICPFFCQNNTKLASLVIPGNVKTIGKKAFYRNACLKEITFEEGVEYIGQYAFGYEEDEMEGAYSGNKPFISSLVIPSSVKTIDSYAFSGIKVDKLHFADGVGTLGNRCFATISTDSIILPSSVKLDNWYCFGYSLIKYADVSRVKGKLNGAFYRCRFLNKVLLNDELETIHSDFQDCISLTSIKLPKNLKEIGLEEFMGTPIEHLYVPETVTKIGSGLLMSSGMYGDPPFVSSVTIEGNEFSPKVFMDGSFCCSGETVNSEKKLNGLYIFKDAEYFIDINSMGSEYTSNVGMDTLVIGNVHEFVIKSQTDKRFLPQTAICLSPHLTSCDMWKPSDGKVYVLPGSKLPEEDVYFMYNVYQLNYEKSSAEDVVFRGHNNMPFNIEPVFFQDNVEVEFKESGVYDLSMKISGTNFDGIYPTGVKLTIENESAIHQVVYDEDDNKPIYTLDGRKGFNNNGVIIQNGKKRIVRH